MTAIQARRVTNDQKNHYKRILAWVAFMAVSILMTLLTFFNPYYMKQQIRQSANEVVVTKQANVHFNTLAKYLNAYDDQTASSLTTNELLPIADELIDWTLGVHAFRTSDTLLASNIYDHLKKNISNSSTVGAKEVKKRMLKNPAASLSYIDAAYSLSVVSLTGNLELILFAVGVILLISIVVMLKSFLQEMGSSLQSRKMFIHEVSAAIMWMAFWTIFIYGLLSVLPIFISLDNLGLGIIAFLFETSSPTFLNFVIAGVVLYIISAISWQATSVK
ncbi:MAG: hypothetical protein Q3960_04075 [Lactobacillus sp.]|nr:hypothetical protein [Lactobacillus sp.]